MSKIQKLSLNTLSKSLTKTQSKVLSPLIKSSPPEKLRKTVYLSTAGEFVKYASFLRMFTYKLGYVPVHPVETLDYYLSFCNHKNDRREIIRDRFSLLQNCDELWIFTEYLIDFSKGTLADIKQFSEGVLAEMYFWLEYKPQAPIRLFSLSDTGIPKYSRDNKHTLLKQGVEKALSGKQRNFAVIDMGSSTVKLIIYSVDESKNTEIQSKKWITVNLAEDFFKDSMLKEPSMDRTLQAIKEFQEEALTFGVVDIELIGTGVIRKAKNSDHFKKRIKDKTNLDLKVITGKSEGGYVFDAVYESFVDKPKKLIVINAGGGSTELIHMKKDKLEVDSLAVGISDLNEKFFNTNPVNTQTHDKAKKHIISILEERLGKIAHGSEIMVYTGGELDYMLITGFPLENYDNSLSHPKKISLDAFKQHAAKMRKLSLEELHAYMPGNPKWMNGAISSNTLLETLAEFLKIDVIVPSNKNLNDGILINMYKPT